MNKIIRIALGFVLVLSCLQVSARVHYGFSVNAGLSNLYELNHSYLYDENGYRIKGQLEYNSVNYFTSSSMYALEGFVIEPLEQTRFSLEQGLMLESTSYFFNTPEIIFTKDTIFSNKWEERFVSVGIPLRVRYEFENWLTFYLGVNNIFHVYDNNEIIYNKPLLYTLRGEAGVDFTLFSHLIVGAKYAHDISPFTKLSDYDVSYRFEIVSLKLGFCF